MNKEDLDKIISNLGEDANKSITWKDLIEFEAQLLNMLSDTLLESDKKVYDKVGDWINEIKEDYNIKFYFTMGTLYGETANWLPTYEKYCNMIKEVLEEE